MLESRPYDGTDDLRAPQTVAQRAWRHDRCMVDVGGTVGELAWSLAGLVPDHEWTGELWLRDGVVEAYATLQWAPELISKPGERVVRPDTLDWQMAVDDAGLLEQILDWAEARAGPALTTSVRNANTAGASVLLRRGYTADPHAPWSLLNVRTLDDVEAPLIPEGFRLLTMSDVGDVAARVELHRASWDGSRMTAARYADVMDTWPYDPSLDCVLAAPDGTLVASALAWYDPELHLGELEPVGTHRDHRRRGFAQAVNLFALQRLREAGAREVIVACRGDDDYPIPRKLYASVGFRELSRQVPYVKTLS
jgi:GNAT superfamily N-acetyltransferase